MLEMAAASTNPRAHLVEGGAGYGLADAVQLFDLAYELIADAGP